MQPQEHDLYDDVTSAQDSSSLATEDSNRRQLKPWPCQEDDLCPALERALRFVIGAIGPLIISFGYKLPTDPQESLLNLQLSYLCCIFYCVFAALAPPQLSSVSIVACGALIGILFGIVLATCAFLTAMFAGRIWGLVVYGLGVLIVSPLKTGSISPLTYLTLNCCVYGGAFGYIMLAHFASPGLHIEGPMDDVLDMFNMFNSNPKFKHVLPASILNDAVMLFFQLQSTCSAKGNATIPSGCHVHKSGITITEGDLEGITLDIYMTKESVSLQLQPGLGLLNLIWTSWGPLGVIPPLLTLFFIAVGFYALSLLVPLPNVRTAYNLTRADLVKMIARPLSKSLSATEEAFSQTENHHSYQAAIQTAQVAADEVTDRCTFLLQISKISSFEPSWPAMGLPLLRIMPDIVIAVRMCARTAAEQAKLSITEKPELVQRAISASRLVLQRSAGVLVSMPHCGDALLGVVGGPLELLEEAVKQLTEVSNCLSEDNEGWSLRYGVVDSSLNVADKVVKLAHCRLKAQQTSGGALKASLMMLLGFIIPFAAPFYRFGLRLLECWRPRRRGGGVDWRDVRIEISYSIGITALVALPLFIPAWANFGVDYALTKKLGLPGRFSIWCVLGFLASFQPTLEGALMKSSLRILGTCFGCFSAWIALTLFPTNKEALITWLLVTYGIAVAFGSNPMNRLLGFNVVWGYAAQLFTYTQTIIVIECYVGVASVSNLVVSRLFGQLLGISVAVLMSCIVWVRTKYAAKDRVAAAFDICSALLEDWQHQKLGASEFLLFAAAEKLEAAQVALDDAKVDALPRDGRPRTLIVGLGGVGIEEARDVLEDCRRIYRLLKDAEMTPFLHTELMVSKAAFEAASARLRSEVPSSELKAIVGTAAATNEVTWLLQRAAARAGLAGSVLQSDMSSDLPI